MHILCRIVAGSRLPASPHHSHALPDGTAVRGLHRRRVVGWLLAQLFIPHSHVLKFKSGHIVVGTIDACYHIDELRFSSSPSAWNIVYP